MDNNARRLCALLAAAALALTGCGSAKYDMPYEEQGSVSSYQLINIANRETIEPFAKELCVTAGDVTAGGPGLQQVGGAALLGTKKLGKQDGENGAHQVKPARSAKG